MEEKIEALIAEVAFEHGARVGNVRIIAGKLRASVQVADPDQWSSALNAVAEVLNQTWSGDWFIIGEDYEGAPIPMAHRRGLGRTARKRPSSSHPGTRNERLRD